MVAMTLLLKIYSTEYTQSSVIWDYSHYKISQKWLPLALTFKLATLNILLAITDVTHYQNSQKMATMALLF